MSLSIAAWQTKNSQAFPVRLSLGLAMKAVAFISGGKLALGGSGFEVLSSHEVSLNLKEEFLGLETYQVQQDTKEMC